MQTIDGGGTPAAGAEAAVTPQDFIAALTLFLVCQLAGETLMRLLGVAWPHFAFPGPVAGMVFLFGLLAARGRIGPAVGVASNGILRNLSLLFVPAAVGIVQYGGVIAEFGVASHGIGTARAFQVSELAGTFAGIAMGLNGALTSIIVLVWIAVFG